MSEDGEDRFKRIMELHNSGLRLLGAANATGALAAGAAYQAFEKRPDAQSSIKEIIVIFFAGIIAFTVSQIAIHLAQIYMERYFRQSIEPAVWESTLWVDRKPDENYLRMVRHDLIVMAFATIASAGLFLFGLALIARFLYILWDRITEDETRGLSILVAIISVIGTLAGTIVGGTIVTAGNYFLARRRETIEFRTACRLVAAELEDTYLNVKYAVNNKLWWRSDEAPTLEAWKQYKNILAPHLIIWGLVLCTDGGTWYTNTNVLAGAPRPTDKKDEIVLGETEHALTILMENIEAGRVALMPHL